ncbi:hypothetical protein LIER_06237 [Lithospermum erythrorhizon]|uniref:Uncharacterized protein n=1 Tax=Lithospermum erythrorhizon TaxID=34254 RepID=A0AAV3P5B2_LITER
MHHVSLSCFGLICFFFFEFGLDTYGSSYFALFQVMDSRPASLEYTSSYLFYHTQRRTWLWLCRSLQGRTLRELTDMADEVLAQVADGHAFNFPFLPALRRALECYFEKVGSAFQVVSEVD